jgi:hypothetical protein
MKEAFLWERPKLGSLAGRNKGFFGEGAHLLDEGAFLWGAHLAAWFWHPPVDVLT